MKNSLEKIYRIEIGTSAISIVAVLFVISFILQTRYPAFRYISPLLLCGFIGGFTNTVAIKMLFKRYRFLPGSGVILKRRREIINSLAKSVETYIINPEMLEGKLRQAVERIDRDKMNRALNIAIDEFRGELLDYVNSTRVHLKIKKAVEEKLGLMGKVTNWTGIKDMDVAADEIQDYISSRVSKFKLTDSLLDSAMEKTGSLEDFIFKPGNQFIKKHYGTDMSPAQLMFSRFDVKRIVVEKLSGYPPEKIRDIIAENIKRHLTWLEVFGVILGMIFSGLYLLFQ